AVLLETQPRPAATELAGGRCRKLLLEAGEGAKDRIDGLSEIAPGLATTIRGARRPEQRMVGVTATVIAHCRPDVVRDAVDAAQQILYRLAPQLGVLLQGGVQLVDIRLVVLLMMDLHRPRIDVRLERVVWIWQIGEAVCHDSSINSG